MGRYLSEKDGSEPSNRPRHPEPRDDSDRADQLDDDRRNEDETRNDPREAATEDQELILQLQIESDLPRSGLVG